MTAAVGQQLQATGVVASAEPLGTAIETVLVNSSALLTWPDGRPALATVGGTADQPVVFSVIDPHDGSLLATHRIANSQRSHDLTVAGGSVFISSWGGGNLFRYDPATDRLTDLGMALPGQTLLAGTVLAGADRSAIFGGTFPGGRLFRRDLDDDTVTDLGALDRREDMVRSLAWDGTSLYAGTETHARLYRVNPTGGGRTQILMPAAAGEDKSVDHLAVRAGLLFVHSSPSQSWHGLDLTTHRWRGRLPGRLDRGISEVDPSGWVYLIGDDGLQRYAVADGVFEVVSCPLPAGASGGHGGVHLIEDDHRPGEDPATVIIGIASQGSIWRYEPVSRTSRTLESGVPATGVTIRALGLGSAGQVLIGGSMAPTTYAEWLPEARSFRRFSGGPGSRIDAFATLKGRTYFSQYPSAAVFEYDPAEPYAGPPSNPRQLCALADTHHQAYVFALAAHGDDLFIGSTGGRGLADGRLLRWSTVTNQLTDLGNPVQNHSVVSLATVNTDLVGGTSVQVLGAPASDTEAKLFVSDPDTGVPVWSGTPQPGALAICALTTTPAHQVWGLTTKGHVFRFDPTTRTFHDLAKVGPDGGIWGMGSLQSHRSLLVGSTASGTVFAFHTRSHQVTYLGLGEHAVVGADAALYWAHGSELIRLPLAALTERHDQ